MAPSLGASASVTTKSFVQCQNNNEKPAVTNPKLDDNITNSIGFDTRKDHIDQPKSILNQRRHLQKQEKNVDVTDSSVNDEIGNDEKSDATIVDKTTNLSKAELNNINRTGELVWLNIILFIILHSCIPIGAYIAWTQRPFKTLIYSLLLAYLGGLGVTAGAHRLWSHRSYKARWPVQVILVILQTLAGQNSVYTWCRDHRVHHKFSETDADPHNIKRGFFFAHMGWLCTRKHPDVIAKGKLIDMSDLAANPYVAFQHKHFWWMTVLFTFALPVAIPCLVWNERFWTSFVLAFMLRYTVLLHATWLVNSAAHYYGSRPYDDTMEARESPIVIANALGEGFHNYHHAFPNDYATSEFGKFFNITTAFIDSMASIGLVYGRRSMNPKVVLQRRARSGNLRH